MARSRAIIIAMLLLVFGNEIAWAYRLGDPIDTELSIDGAPPKDVYRSHMPHFGIRSRPEFALKSGSSFTLSFEDGLWILPMIYIETPRGDKLSSLEVTFVYSKSGHGMIHSVSCTPSYGEKKNKSSAREETTSTEDGTFRLKYVWIEEEDVNLAAGQSIMYLIVFVSTMIFSILSCTTNVDGYDTVSGASSPNEYFDHAPKWQ